MKSYRDLDVWKLSRELALAIDLEYADVTQVDKILAKSDRISKMLYALHQSLSTKNDEPLTEYRVPSTEYV